MHAESSCKFILTSLIFLISFSLLLPLSLFLLSLYLFSVSLPRFPHPFFLLLRSLRIYNDHEFYSFPQHCVPSIPFLTFPFPFPFLFPSLPFPSLIQLTNTCRKVALMSHGHIKHQMLLNFSAEGQERILGPLKIDSTRGSGIAVTVLH